MGAISKIEWTDASWTPIRARNRATGKVGWFCEHKSGGCKYCYAESMNARLGTGIDFKPGHRKDIDIFLDEKMLLAPLRWKKPRMIFACSMTDLFADFVPDAWIDKIFAVMALCPQHTFQVLTKRAERMRDYTISLCESEDHLERICDAAVATTSSPCAAHVEDVTLPLPNVWIGVSAKNQQEFDERWLHLCNTPAAVTFISMEPLLGPIFFRPAKPDWIIVGGESGPNARPMHPDWVRDLREQCAAAGVPFFFKQWGEWVGGTYTGDLQNQDVRGAKHERLKLHDFGEGCFTAKCGKKVAGRLLDGIEHNGMPEVRA